MLIDHSEIEDFKSILKRYELPEDSFDLIEIHNEIPPGVSHLRGVIKIRHKKKGIEREYKAGFGSH